MVHRGHQLQPAIPLTYYSLSEDSVKDINMFKIFKVGCLTNFNTTLKHFTQNFLLILLKMVYDINLYYGRKALNKLPGTTRGHSIKLEPLIFGESDLFSTLFLTFSMSDNKTPIHGWNLSWLHEESVMAPTEICQGARRNLSPLQGNLCHCRVSVMAKLCGYEQMKSRLDQQTGKNTEHQT